MWSDLQREHSVHNHREEDTIVETHCINSSSVQWCTKHRDMERGKKVIWKVILHHISDKWASACVLNTGRLVPVWWINTKFLRIIAFILWWNNSILMRALSSCPYPQSTRAHWMVCWGWKSGAIVFTVTRSQPKQTPMGDRRVSRRSPPSTSKHQSREYLLEKFVERFVETCTRVKFFPPQSSVLCKPEEERRSLEMPRQFSVVEAVCLKAIFSATTTEGVEGNKLMSPLNLQLLIIVICLG